MSLEFQNRVLSMSKTNRSQRLLLMILAHHADKHGVCWPSVATLAAEMGAAERNVKTLLKKLKSTEEIVIVSGGGRHKSNTYLITLGQSAAEIEQTLVSHHRLNSDVSITVYNDKKGDVLSRKGDVLSRKGDQNITRTTIELSKNLNDELPADDGGGENLPFDPIPIDPELGRCKTIYRENIGELGPMQLQDFKDIFSGLSPPPAETKQLWIEYAILAAASNNKNNWAYVKAILKGIDQTGSLQQHKENRNGSTRTGKTKSKTNATQGTESAASGKQSADAYIDANEKNMRDFESKMFH